MQSIKCLVKFWIIKSQPKWCLFIPSWRVSSSFLLSSLPLSSLPLSFPFPVPHFFPSFLFSFLHSYLPLLKFSPCLLSLTLSYFFLFFFLLSFYPFLSSFSTSEGEGVEIGRKRFNKGTSKIGKAMLSCPWDSFRVICGLFFPLWIPRLIFLF